MAIANTYRDLGFPSRAIELLNEIIERHPQDPDPRVQRGLSQFFDGNLQRAVSDLEDALAIDPASKNANHYRAKLNELLGDDESATEFRQKACDLDRENSTLQEALADLLLRVGRFKDAELTYQRALGLNSPEVSSYARQERQRNRCRDLVAAESQIQEWIAGKEQPESFVTAAEICLYKLRDYAAAVRFYELAFEADPSLNQSQRSSHSRDKAAIAALRAAAGEGIKPIPDSDRTLFRRKALAWLQTELQAQTTELPVLSLHGPQLREKLRAYQTASHYATVRGDALFSLASEERDSWEAFWHMLQQSLVIKLR